MRSCRAGRVHVALTSRHPPRARQSYGRGSNEQWAGPTPVDITAGSRDTRGMPCQRGRSTARTRPSSDKNAGSAPIVAIAVSAVVAGKALVLLERACALAPRGPALGVVTARLVRPAPALRHERALATGVDASGVTRPRVRERDRDPGVGARVARAGVDVGPCIRVCTGVVDLGATVGAVARADLEALPIVLAGLRTRHAARARAGSALAGCTQRFKRCGPAGCQEERSVKSEVRIGSSYASAAAVSLGRWRGVSSTARANGVNRRSSRRATLRAHPVAHEVELPERVSRDEHQSDSVLRILGRARGVLCRGVAQDDDGALSARAKLALDLCTRICESS